MNQINHIESKQINSSTNYIEISVSREIEGEVDLQEAYENNNYFKTLDPEDFSTDRGWWYRCRVCNENTRINGRNPKCSHC